MASITHSKKGSIQAHFKPKNVYSEETNFYNKDRPTASIKITTPNFQKKIEKTFIFVIDDTIWEAKQKVLTEFSNLEFRDPLNFGFYLPPNSGRAGKFLDESRILKDYPMALSEAQLEFRYKRRIFRHIHTQDEKRLLKINTKKHQKKFMEFITARNITEMEHLLEKGLDPNFHDEKSGDTPLIVASMMDDCIAILKLLVMFGAYLDFRSHSGLTALHAVANIGKLESMKGLLDLGASPNYRDASGFTPLYHSIVSGSSPNISQSLLYERSEIGIIDLHGFSEIHQACKHGHSQHLEHLIYYGADMNSRTSSGSTPLHICALENQESCARVLCFRGADRNLRNYSQQTPYEVAIVANNFDVAAVINEFNESDVKRFNEKPVFSKRRSKSSSKNSNQLDISSLAPATVNTSSLPPTICSVDSPNSVSNIEGIQKPEIPSNSLNPYSEMLPDYSESETDSEDDSGIKSKSNRRTFSNGGLGTQRSPAPIKIKQTVPITLRKRLYASVPGRQYIAITDYEPTQAGEIKLDKGDAVEVLYIGEQGFWEGKVENRAGWFPGYCVQEISKSLNGADKKRSWFGSKKSPIDIVDKVSKLDTPKEREVVLKRGDKGYGFQMRGANSHVPHIEFHPTPQFPALQYIGEVDKGGIADKAGLKAGDFVLAINGEEVISATHGYAVSLINKGGKSLTIKVITVAPEIVNPELILQNGSLRSKDASELKESLKAAGVNIVEKNKPLPPTRSITTSLSQFGNEEGESSLLSEAAIALESETVVLEKSNFRNTSMKGMWAGNAFKLKGEELKIRDEDISRGISRRQKGLTCDFASDFDQRFKLITKQYDTKFNSNPSLANLSFEEKSENMSKNSKAVPQITPPDYDSTIENIRKGRTNSLSGTENKPNKNIIPQEIIDVMRFEITSNYDFRSTSSYSPEDYNQQDGKSAVAHTVLSAHQNMLYSTDSIARLSSPEGSKTIPFVHQDNISRQTLQVDGLVRMQHLRQQQMKIPPIPTAMPPPPPLSENRSPSPQFSNYIPPPPQLPSLNSLAYSKTETTCNSSKTTIDNNLRKSGDNSMNDHDHSSVLSQAIAARAAKISKTTDLSTDLSNTKKTNLTASSLVTKKTELDNISSVAKTTDSGLPITKETSESENLKESFSKKNFFKPDSEKVENEIEIEDKEKKSLVTMKNVSLTSITKSPEIKAQKKELPPSTKPKPKKNASENTKLNTSFVVTDSVSNGSNVNNKNATTSDLTNVDVAVISDVNNSSSEIIPIVINSKSQKVSLSEQIATSYLDGVIADAEASLDYELILSNRTATNSGSEVLSELLPPPPSNVIQLTDYNDLRDEFLPPPPNDLLSEIENEKITNNKHIPDKNDTALAIPMTILPRKIAEKHFKEWTVNDVGDWLDYLNLSQYKKTFSDNDIMGNHLSDLTKDELRELGVDKLGHRKTIDDAIKKLLINS
ncbi:SH3 and multiple ankyrin repeat domains protein 2 isoform X1 [Hydra vulgaris]|uniref:SH3 and multiple ankyrin repeat domains protein 2 isoform X1 n=1 Tax=Hydra vulgaris TaxID=6087 RepID=UPI000640C8EB|nr:unnamed protein product [Hydra vulgaris]XP_047125797.1 SH3 and multiple ankyrin repeat domains protein 2 [Hydra vulgaris]